METVVPFHKHAKKRPSKAERQKSLGEKVISAKPDEASNTPAIPEREPEPEPSLPAPVKPPEPETPPPSPEAKTPEPETKTPTPEPKTRGKNGGKTEAKTPEKPDKKKAKGPSLTVINWKKQAPFDEKSVITLIAENTPKSGKAALRFQKYKNNMTVLSYQELIKSVYGRTFKQTMDDIRWDFVSGFIRIDGKSFQ